MTGTETGPPTTGAQGVMTNHRPRLLSQRLHAKAVKGIEETQERAGRLFSANQFETDRLDARIDALEARGAPPGDGTVTTYDATQVRLRVLELCLDCLSVGAAKDAAALLSDWVLGVVDSG